jgi:hypothetical protein
MSWLNRRMELINFAVSGSLFARSSGLDGKAIDHEASS